jgi:hypothetical protein
LLRVRHPLLIVLLGVATFFLLDFAIFRSGLYLRIVPPVTTSAKLLAAVRAESARPSSPRRDVLITGNSRMEFGFQEDYLQRHPDARIAPVKVAVPGSDLKWWYYILKDIDPRQDRYAAVVLSVNAYKIEPGLLDDENAYSTAQSIVPILHIDEIPAFVDTFTDPPTRARVLRKALMVGRGAALEWLLPIWRGMVRVLQGGQLRQLDPVNPPLQTVEKLQVSPDGKVIDYPDHFDAFQKKDADESYVRAPEADIRKETEENARFQEKWLRRIADLYTGSATRIIVVQLPRWPAPLPAVTPENDAPDLRNDLADVSNINFVDDQEFQYLENPRYFTDVFHMNSRGQAEFTEKFVPRLEKMLAAAPPAGHRDATDAPRLQ